MSRTTLPHSWTSRASSGSTDSPLLIKLPASRHGDSTPKQDPRVGALIAPLFIGLPARLTTDIDEGLIDADQGFAVGLNQFRTAPCMVLPMNSGLRTVFSS